MTLEEELREKERLQRMQGQKANIFGISKTPEQPSSTELDWKRALSEAPVIGKDTDLTGIDNIQDAKELKPNDEARMAYNEQLKDSPKESNKLGSTALSALAGLGKAMSSPQKLPEMPKLNPLKTIEPQDVMEARRKALMQLRVRKK